jgi:hypothetical protein
MLSQPNPTEPTSHRPTQDEVETVAGAGGLSIRVSCGPECGRVGRTAIEQHIIGNED